jgi:hypothetical protein
MTAAGAAKKAKPTAKNINICFMIVAYLRRAKSPWLAASFA